MIKNDKKVIKWDLTTTKECVLEYWEPKSKYLLYRNILRYICLILVISIVVAIVCCDILEFNKPIPLSIYMTIALLIVVLVGTGLYDIWDNWYHGINYKLKEKYFDEYVKDNGKTMSNLRYEND